MKLLHIFLSTARFRSFAEMRAFIDETYTDDGDGVPSIFMEEVGLQHYEPACIEAIWAEHPTPIHKLLAKASYSAEWLPTVPGAYQADAAICVFEPNVLKHPRESSLEYIGVFEYPGVHSAWFQDLMESKK